VFAFLRFLSLFPLLTALRLLLTYSYCKAIVQFQQKFQVAKVIAEKLFFLASDSRYDIPAESLQVLQQLRDEFMMYEKPQRKKIPLENPPKLIPGKILTSEESEAIQKTLESNEIYEDEILEATGALKSVVPPEEMDVIENVFFPKRKASKIKEIQNIKNQRQLRYLDEEDEHGEKVGAGDEDMNNKTNENKKYRLALQIRRSLSVAVNSGPIEMESLVSAAAILKAVDRIFRVYIRGNALPGQQIGGNTVDLAGNTLSFRTFVLGGPYLSWKGFLSFLLDFSVAALPDPSSKTGKNFYSSLHPSTAKELIERQEMASNPMPTTPTTAKAGAGGGSSANVEAVVSLLEAAMIFIESARSASPVLVIQKYKTLYAELAETLETDPWKNVYDWTRTNSNESATNDRQAFVVSLNEWNQIAFGLNFMQFVDCLGKLGVLSYSARVFRTMLPTAKEKIEHFFTAFLGLTDERKWLKKVDNKLKKAKMMMKEIKESNNSGGGGKK
jgi:hypothetical protein